MRFKHTNILSEKDTLVALNKTLRMIQSATSLGQLSSAYRYFELLKKVSTINEIPSDIQNAWRKKEEELLPIRL